MRGLKDRNVIVTGGGGAIGGAICRRFASYGARVGVFDKNLEAATRVADEIRRSGGGVAEPVGVDITSYAAVKDAVDLFAREVGPADILVNNAGWDRFANFVDTTPDLWETLIAINLKGPLNLHHATLPGMLERGWGRVVNIASDAGRVGSSQEAVYSACKGGIIAFTKTIAREASRANINVNCVCPGPTDTPLFDAFKAQSADGAKIAEGLARAIPFRRLGRPDDYPGIVAFLASDDAAYITGQVISVSGGLTMSG